MPFEYSRRYIHCADWFSTFLTLAGGDPTDSHPGLPAVDGLDMWPYLSGAAATSPRTEMMIGTELVEQKRNAKPVTKPGWSGALIVGAFKIIIGVQSYGFWQGPIYPNATTDHSTEVVDLSCGERGCLFNIQVSFLFTVTTSR